jgi:hypothetical protein
VTTYSVYDWNRQVYDYYQGSGPKGTHAGSPPKAYFKSALGATPEQAAWKLPGDAVKVGSGVLPRGRIASTGAGSALGGVDLATGGKIAIALAIAYAAWKAAGRK